MASILLIDDSEVVQNLDGVKRVLNPQGIADAMLQQVQEGKRP